MINQRGDSRTSQPENQLEARDRQKLMIIASFVSTVFENFRDGERLRLLDDIAGKVLPMLYFVCSRNAARPSSCIVTFSVPNTTREREQKRKVYFNYLFRSVIRCPIASGAIDREFHLTTRAVERARSSSR